MKRKAFTLLELLVVLAVIAIISSMTFGVIGNIAESNRKLTCTANLAQVYGAARLYAQDYDGKFPYYNPSGGGRPISGIQEQTPETTDQKTGLWALLQYDASHNYKRSGYLKSIERMHCPSDRFNTDASLPTYLSYQQQDDVPDELTYVTFRQPGSNRQLWYFENSSPVKKTVRRVSDTTVVTWCRYHRRLKSDASGSTYDLTSTKDRDNVLFFDGRVQSLPTTQLVSEAAPKTGTGECSGWKRVPIQLENSLANASECLPPN